MKRLFISLALLVASAAPSWAQSDSRFIVIFANCGTINRGGDRYGDVGIPWGRNPHVVTTMLQRMGIPYKIVPLCDSLGGWTSSLGTTRNTDEADSVYFRRIGAMGWISFMDAFSTATAAKQFAGEIRCVFTDAEGNTGVQRGSPTDGNWGIPGVIFTAGNGISSGGGLSMGMTGSPYSVSGHARNRSLFANGDSLGTENQRAYLPAAGEVADVTTVISLPDYDANGDSLPVTAWRYKTSTLYYSSACDPYLDPKMLMLGVADVINRAGYTPRRKLNFHFDADHIFPDATVQTAPTDSLFAYWNAQGNNWRFSGPIEANATELANDDPALKAIWLTKKTSLVSHPHSHDFLNFGDNTKWNFTTFSDSATKRARWNDMNRAIQDTIGAVLNAGAERIATFPNNDVMFPDLYIMASDGYRDIRVKNSLSGAVDSIGPSATTNLKRWQRVPSPLPASTNFAVYGFPYMYIEPKTNLPLYVHDSFENPASSDSLSTAQTDFSVSMEGFCSRDLSAKVRMAIWDGGQYWHPDINVTRGRFMADFYRRFTYFYGRVKNIATVQPIYLPKTPRTGGTSRNTYSDNR